MADPDDKLEDNVPGKWYVDSNCIDCDVCRTTAPNNFEANEDEGYSFVSKQPENDDETTRSKRRWSPARPRLSATTAEQTTSNFLPAGS